MYTFQNTWIRLTEVFVFNNNGIHVKVIYEIIPYNEYFVNSIKITQEVLEELKDHGQMVPL